MRILLVPQTKLHDRKELVSVYALATVVYSHCTNRFEHHTVAVFSLGGATAR